ncbi:phosphatase PAP2 family protein [Paraburkholderia tropica]|uniref:PAP2 superfamily protein n=1 Tax=Paraburkholderia tropica TaxID=92647 RepID=A0A1A5XF35_9BURK|nr:MULTISPECIES: phosphatase PAP2 family protein [Paraburkholderia]MBB2978809.1 membrane-associated phospholipid phosphatase [Paraburkholderia tropica]MBB2999361.1 membrane-associated phospholipid phosphatase [Paraburkholderia tropica]MBB6318739.1 membrane-associated phospholipid phosphatase [Paraburkholderia tropica]MDE1139084.1 phosphatase PAP2 family protein [Paraburkholderia tropica]OBR51790.1 phosphoesterase [Paraburkholderia tropica]
MPDLPAHLWISITNLGGAGLTLPLALGIALWLLTGYSWRMAASWLLLLGASIGLVTVTKIAFLGWGVGVRSYDFTGLSGHAMLSTAVYPVAFFLMLQGSRTALRATGVAIGLAVGIAVGTSRVVLVAHSPSEAVTGCIVGALTALAFVVYWWKTPSTRISAAVVTLSLAVLAFAVHDVRVPTHRWVTNLALTVSGHNQPYVRAKWKANRNRLAPGTPNAPVSQTRDTLTPTLQRVA